MRFAAALLVALVLAPAAAAQPNVILIVTDDQRWDTLGYMPTVQSELVKKGVTFTNSYVVNPLCCPARATLLTGTYSHTNGVWANAGVHGGFTAFDDRSTLPVWLDAAGYETMLIGKYMNGYWPPWATSTYVPPGWDRWFANWGHPQLYYDFSMTDGESILTYGSERADYATDVLAERAVTFIRESGADPFFLYVATKAPHITWGRRSPYETDPAPRHIGAFADLDPWQPPSVNEPDVTGKPQYIRARPTIPADKLVQLRQEQLESLLAVDDAVAGMLAALEENGKLSNTMIVFTSDNGYLWGEHRWIQKTVPYEESLRVPLVIRYDALAEPARRERRFALNVDLAATIGHAAGFSVKTDGRSLLPLMVGGQLPWRRSFLIEHFDRPWVVPTYCGFRDRRWKYVQYGTGEEELYNLRLDPYELRNLRSQRPALGIAYRKRVVRSACRPPRFTPLPPCTIIGTAGPDRIRGTKRRDWICAGAGRDVIRVRGGKKDVVRCGRGFDTVYADRRDVVHTNCERVVRQ